MIKNFGNKKQKQITIIGIGGGGQNIVNYLHNRMHNVNLISINSDEQILHFAKTKAILVTDNNAIILSKNKVLILLKFLTDKIFAIKQSLGCGGDVNRGRYLAEKHIEKIAKLSGVADSDKVILISTFGGGFGTGATPVIAKYLKTSGIKNSAIVTIPFPFEGQIRMNAGESGVNELKKYVEDYDVLNNEQFMQDNANNITIKDLFDNVGELFHTRILLRIGGRYVSDGRWI